MRTWIFGWLFKDELKRLREVGHPALDRLADYKGPSAADFVLADLILLARKSDDLDFAVRKIEALQRQQDMLCAARARESKALAASNEQLLALWARAYMFIPDAVRAEFVGLGRPEPWQKGRDPNGPGNN